MNTPQEQDKELRALDALIAAALDQPDRDNIAYSDLVKYQEKLTAEDVAALARTPPDLAAQLLRGATGSTQARIPPTPHSGERARPLAAAMNRGDESGELTDAARAEMERKIREAQKKQTPPEQDPKP